MDIVSHAGWGYAALRWRGEKAARIGALVGAAPDLLAFVPSAAHQILQDGGNGPPRMERNPSFWREAGPLPPDLQYVYDHYYVFTHSLIVLLGVCGLLWLLRKRSWLWFAIPYGLHILMDIPTHVRFQTPFLYPLSRWTFQGTGWSEPWVFWPNWILLIATLWWCRRRYGNNP